MILGVLGYFSVRFMIQSVLLILLVYLSVCFFTLLERKYLGYLQNRKGPNKVGLNGLLQPVLDGLKLIFKSFFIVGFGFMGLVSFVIILLMSMMLLILLFDGVSIWFVSSVFYTLIISSVMVYIIFLLGWFSESSYGVLGSLRSSSQMVSYEILMLLMFLIFMMFHISVSWGYLNFSSFYCLDLFFLWLFFVLVESNRSPFDFAEGESELVSGFNIEYFGVYFALIFIAEYGMLLVFSLISSMLFLNSFMIFIFFSLVVLIRGVLPRSRYDLLMNICWKFLFIYMSFLFFKFFL